VGRLIVNAHGADLLTPFQPGNPYPSRSRSFVRVRPCAVVRAGPEERSDEGFVRDHAVRAAARLSTDLLGVNPIVKEFVRAHCMECGPTRPTSVPGPYYHPSKGRGLTAPTDGAVLEIE